VLMSEDLRADHVKVEIKSLYFNKKLFFCPAIGGGGLPPSLSTPVSSTFILTHDSLAFQVRVHPMHVSMAVGRVTARRCGKGEFKLTKPCPICASSKQLRRISQYLNSPTPRFPVEAMFFALEMMLFFNADQCRHF